MAILKVENRPEEGIIWVEVLRKAIVYRYSLVGISEFPEHDVKLIGINVDGKERQVSIREGNKEKNIFKSEEITQSLISNLQYGNKYAFFRYEIMLNNTDTITLTENKVSKTLKEKDGIQYYIQPEGAQGTRFVYSAYVNGELEETQIVYMDYEDAFLTDYNFETETGTSFKIKYNPKVNMKINRQEQKVETLESPFPFILRSPISYYEFDIQGMIAKEAPIIEDPYETFLKVSNGFTHESTISFREERAYRKQILDWLTNGQEKILRTPTEGEFDVSLMNVSVTPMDQLGRKYYSFSATAVCSGEHSSNIDSNVNIGPVLKTENIEYKVNNVDIDTQPLNVYRFVINPDSIFKGGDFLSKMVITLNNKETKANYVFRIGGEGRSFNKIEHKKKKEDGALEDIKFVVNDRLEYTFDENGLREGRLNRVVLNHVDSNGKIKETYNIQQTAGLNLPPITLYCFLGDEDDFSKLRSADNSAKAEAEEILKFTCTINQSRLLEVPNS